MRLKKAQREQLLEWIAEGLDTGEINKRAAKFKPRFKVSTRLVTHYRKTRNIKVEAIKSIGETNALISGLAIKENRVAKLQALADRMLADLLEKDKLWLLQVKGIGGTENYERVEYYEFNKAEVDALRGILDDIASEVGGRVRKADLTTAGKPIGQPAVPLAALKGLPDDQLRILEEAARIIADSEPDPAASKPG